MTSTRVGRLYVLRHFGIRVSKFIDLHVNKKRLNVENSILDITWEKMKASLMPMLGVLGYGIVI